MAQNESNPYVGPRPFERKKEDSDRFFGRSHETQEIVSLIFGHPVTLVYAQSGAGKTSLFNASVAVNLEENGFDVLPLTRVGGLVPKDIAIDKIRNLYIFNALLHMDPESDPQVLLSKSLSEFLEMRPRTTDENGQQLPRAIIFDQFEELFTYTPEDWREQRKGFFLQVVDALNADKLLRVVFVIREDYLAELDPYARDLPERLRIRYRLERLGEDAALRAIKNPLKNTSRHFAPEVAEKLIDGLLATRVVDATGNANTIKGQYVEPVQLQVVCVTLWDSLASDVTEIQEIHLKDFDVNSALSDFYKSAIEGAVKDTGVKETDLRNLFGRTLITPMETRNTVFRGKESTGGIPNEAMDYLESRHIIRAEFRAGVRWYELTHDRFIEAILANNKDWFAKRRKAMGNPLTEPAQEWNRLGKDKGSLPRGAALNEMDNWAETHKNELDDLEIEFLEASWALYDEELAAKTRSEKRLRNLVIGLGVALIFAVGAIFTAINRATIANVQTNIANTQQAIADANAAVASTAQAQAEFEAKNAEEQKEAAEVAKEEALAGKLALQAISNLKTDPQLGILLAIEANRIRHTPETDDTLRQALQSHQIQSLSIQNRVNALAFSPDGKYLVTGDETGVVTLWDASTWRSLKTWGGDEGNGAGVNFIVFDRDGVNFVTGRSDGSVAFWPVSSLLTDLEDAPSVPLSGLTAEITSLVMSPDGNRIAASSLDGTTLIWDIRDENAIVALKGDSIQVNALAFNPKGDRIVTGDLDKNAIVWDSFTGEELFTLSGHTESVTAVSFSPDGKYIVTAGDDVRIWDSATGEDLGKLVTGTVTGLAFNPVSGLLATEGTDNTIRLWNIGDAINGGEATALTVLQHDYQLTSFSFSPDGQFIATTSDEGYGRLWGVSSGQLQMVFEGHTNSINASAFNKDGTLLATTGLDNTIRIWSIQVDDVQKVLVGENGTIWDIKFNPEGTLLATKGENSTTLWNFEAALISENSEESRTDIEGAGIGFGLDFNSDGTLLATTSADQNGDMQGSTIRVFEVKDPFPEKPSWSHSFEEEVAVNLAFNPDGDLLAISTTGDSENSAVGNIHLWDINKDEEIATLPTLSGYPFGLDFSPDGTLLATSSIGDSTNVSGAIRFWKINDILEGNKDIQPVSLFSNGGAVLLAFDPSGTWLAAGGSDGVVRIWKVANIMNDGDKTELASLSGQSGYVVGLAFSEDGQLLASSDENGSIRVWNVNDVITGNRSEAALSLYSEGGFTYSVAFSPDGKQLLSAGENGEIALWSLNIDDLIAMGCNRLTRNLTQTEWVNYFGKDQEYHRTCDNLPYDRSALEEMINQGKVFARQGKLDDALAMWKKVQELDPDMEVDQDKLLAEVYVDKGQEYAQYEDYDQALEALQKAIELDPSLDFKPGEKLAQWLVERAAQVATSGDYEQAITLLNSAKLYDPGNKFEAAVGKTVRGEFEVGSKNIWVFEGTEGQTVSIQMSDNNSGLDTYLTLVTPSGEVTNNDDSDGTNSRIDLKLTETGTYIIVTSGYGGQGGSYKLTITNLEIQQ